MALKTVDLTQQPHRAVFKGCSQEEVNYAKTFWQSLQLLPPMESRLVSSDIKQRLRKAPPSRSMSECASIIRPSCIESSLFPVTGSSFAEEGRSEDSDQDIWRHRRPMSLVTQTSMIPNFCEPLCGEDTGDRPGMPGKDGSSEGFRTRKISVQSPARDERGAGTGRGSKTCTATGQEAHTLAGGGREFGHKDTDKHSKPVQTGLLGNSQSLGSKEIFRQGEFHCWPSSTQYSSETWDVQDCSDASRLVHINSVPDTHVTGDGSDQTSVQQQKTTYKGRKQGVWGGKKEGRGRKEPAPKTGRQRVIAFPRTPAQSLFHGRNIIFQPSPGDPQQPQSSPPVATKNITTNFEVDLPKQDQGHGGQAGKVKVWTVARKVDEDSLSSQSEPAVLSTTTAHLSDESRSTSQCVGIPRPASKPAMYIKSSKDFVYFTT